MLVDFPRIDKVAFGGTSIWYARYPSKLLVPYGPLTVLLCVPHHTDTQAVVPVVILATVMEFILYT